MSATGAATRWILEVDGVAKTYRTSAGDVPALQRASIGVAEGEVVAVVGASGAGKSTLLLIAAGLLDPSSGTVRLRGQEVRGPSPDRAVMFQDYALLPWRRACDNVAFPLEVQGVGRAERRRRALEALAEVGLADAAARRAHQLSGGMRQRVALARALVTEPAVLLMDEPMSALDAITRERLQGLLARVVRARGQSALLITHSVPEAVLLADRVVTLSGQPGRVLGECRTRGIDPQEAERRVRAQLASGEGASGNGAPGTPPASPGGLRT